MLRRRHFIAAGAGPCLMLCTAVHAQPAPGMRRIGLLEYIAPTDQALLAAGPLELGLRDLGWVEGQNLVIERRYADSNRERLAAHAAELVRLGVEVIVAVGNNATITAHAQTKTVPIVALNVGDPVRLGFAATMARPGGNVTGSTVLSDELMSKRVQLLMEMLPKVARVGEFVDRTSPPAALASRRKARDALYAQLGLDVVYAEVANAADFDAAFAEFGRRRVDAVMLERDLVVIRHADQIARAAIVGRMVTMAAERLYVDRGALVSYAPSWSALQRNGAKLVDRILKGARPGELPFEQPSRIEMVINLRTSEALGITIPQSVRLRADEVIK
jgi:putative ABC transport system substrate-binding protein